MRDINKYTENYIIEDFERYQVKYRKKKILEIIEKYKPITVLEIGCGMEPFYLEYDVGINGKYVVVEPSEMFYKNAVEQAKGKNIVLYNDCFGERSADVNRLGNQFDFIICASLLHELENPLKFINNITQCCNENTIVHINVPNAQSMHRVLAAECGIISDIYAFSERNKQLQQNNVFDMKRLKRIVEENGLEIIEEGSCFVKPFTHSQMFKCIKQGIINEKILDGLYNFAKYVPEFGSEIYINCRLKK